MVARSDRVPELTWRKSKASQGEDSCVEVAVLMGSVLVRDSRCPSAGLLTFLPGQWRTLLTRVRSGALDLS